jgi:hypothetical protein
VKLPLETLLALLLPLTLLAEPSAAAEAIKPGNWEFRSQLRMSPPQSAAARLPSQGTGVTYQHCISAEQSVPADPRPECKTEQVRRSGAVVHWTSVCAKPVGEVRSVGAARYSGDTMEGNLNTRLPNGHGGYFDTVQHLSGRYLGACRRG